MWCKDEVQQTPAKFGRQSKRGLNANAGSGDPRTALTLELDHWMMGRAIFGAFSLITKVRYYYLVRRFIFWRKLRAFVKWWWRWFDGGALCPEVLGE